MDTGIAGKLSPTHPNAEHDFVHNVIHYLAGQAGQRCEICVSHQRSTHHGVIACLRNS